MRRAAAVLLPILSLVAAVPAPAAAQAARGPSFDCARAARPAEKAVCADDSLAGVDRLMARAYRLALRGASADAVKAEQRAWLAGRDRLLAADPTDYGPLTVAYRDRLRALIAAAGPLALADALATVRPIDPLAETTPEGEEEAAFAAFVLTTLLDRPAPPDEDEEVGLPTYDRYAGFTLVAPLADGRLLMAVPDSCGAYQCTVVPFLLDPAGGTAVRAAVEVPAAGGTPAADPQGRPTGMVVVEGTRVSVLTLYRGIGDCGLRTVFRAGAAALELLRVEEKDACDGNDWAPGNTTVTTFRAD
ncbi:lysozyme inhibitor LprI family protein [Azospirillum halopraeferens]|uniref:lysozyme inhibitor LprI family protein n=1 Tax=Azospirillum halopraeferens TaxID=34010 RepID=UPI00041C38EA|nr:lysozyme inhibitor LprI family protein [Azospirillum halopraeferens]